MGVGAKVDQRGDGGRDCARLVWARQPHLFGTHRQSDRLGGYRQFCSHRGCIDFVAACQHHRIALPFGRQKIGLANERCDKPVDRMLIDVARRPHLLQLACRHHADPVRHGQRLFLIMRHENEGDAGFGLQAFQLDLHFLAQLQIERRKRFVQQQNARLRGQRAGQSHALLLAARQLAGLARRQRLQFDQRQHPLHCRGDFGFGTPLHFKAKADVLRHGKVWKQRIALEHRVHRTFVRRQIGDVGTFQQDGALGRHFEPGDQPQQRGLAAARRAQQGKELALLDLHRHIVKRAQCSRALIKYFNDIADFDGDGLAHAGRLPLGFVLIILDSIRSMRQMILRPIA